MNTRWSFFLAGLLMLIAPLSGASGSSTEIKLSRIGIGAGLILCGLPRFNIQKIGSVGRGFLGFALFFTLAALWSSDPVYGLLHKGMFFISCLAGVVLAVSIRSVRELTDGLRILTLFALFGASAVLIAGWTNPDAHYTLGRLSAFQINANMLGQATAVMWILCLAHAVVERSRWKLMSIFAILLLSLIVIETGSRGSVLMVLGGALLIGAGDLARNVKKKSTFALFVLVPAVLVVLVGIEVSGEVDPAFETDAVNSGGQVIVSGGERIQKDMLKDTRSSVWGGVLKKWQNQPVIGMGWFSANHRSRSTLSIYLQVLLECGLVGALWFGVWLIALLRKSARIGIWSLKWPVEYRVYTGLAVGSVAGLLIHGIVESSTMLGASANSLVLGFSIVLMDRIPKLYVNNVAMRDSLLQQLSCDSDSDYAAGILAYDGRGCD